jgi:hypothetical protein
MELDGDLVALLNAVWRDNPDAVRAMLELGDRRSRARRSPEATRTFVDLWVARWGVHWAPSEEVARLFLDVPEARAALHDLTGGGKALTGRQSVWRRLRHLVGAVGALHELQARHGTPQKPAGWRLLRVDVAAPPLPVTPPPSVPGTAVRPAAKAPRPAGPARRSGWEDL